MKKQSQANGSSAFSRLHARQSQYVKNSQKLSRTLMVLSADDHKAIAKLIRSWIDKKV